MITRTKGYSGEFILVFRARDDVVGSDTFDYGLTKHRQFNIIETITVVMHHPTKNTGRAISLESDLSSITGLSFNSNIVFGMQDQPLLLDEIGIIHHKSSHYGNSTNFMAVEEAVEWLRHKHVAFPILTLMKIEESVHYHLRGAFARNASTGMGLIESPTYDLFHQHVVVPVTLKRRRANTIMHTEAMEVVEQISYQMSWRDSIVYDVKNDVWAEYTNMKITNANVLNSGNALDNVNLLLTNNGEIRKYPSNLITEEVGIVTTKIIDIEKGAVTSVGIVGQDHVVRIYETNPDDKEYYYNYVDDYRGEINVKIGLLDEEDSQVKQSRLVTPIKMRAKNNPIPGDDGYGRTFYAQIKNMLSIRRLIFKFKKRTKDKV